MSKPKRKWLSRSLIEGPYLTLCLTPKDFVRAGKDLKIELSPKKWMKTSQSHATQHTYDGPNGLACIVCMKRPAKKRLNRAGSGTLGA